MKYREKFVPISSFRGTPVTRTVASFTSLIVPSGLIVTSGSRLASIRLRLYALARRTASSAFFRSVMSRAAAKTPAISPDSSR